MRARIGGGRPQSGKDLVLASPVSRIEETPKFKGFCVSREANAVSLCRGWPWEAEATLNETLPRIQGESLPLDEESTQGLVLKFPDRPSISDHFCLLGCSALEWKGVAKICSCGRKGEAI